MFNVKFKIVFFILLLGLSCNIAVVFAQEPVAAESLGRVVGTVTCKGTREPAAYIDIRLLPGEHQVQTDGEGRFVFEGIKPGQYTLLIEGEQVETYRQVVVVEAEQEVELSIFLPCFIHTMDEIVVSEQRDQPHAAQHDLSRDELTATPGSGNDPIRAVQNLPGVVSTSPIGGSLVIRGTSPSDSMYIFNGQPIPMLYHFGALVSVVNPELIDTINYYPGGFSVRFGDAIGGVVEVDSRSPRQDRFGGVVDLATYSSYLMFEGPVSDKIAMAGAVRRSFVDFILPYVLPEDQAEFTVVPRFYDYTALVEYRPNHKNILNFTLTGADDRLGVVAEAEDTEEAMLGSSFDMTTAFHRADLTWDFVPNEVIYNTLGAYFIYQFTSVGIGDDRFVDITVGTPILRDQMTLSLADWNELTLGFDFGWGNYRVEADIIQPPKEGDPQGASWSTDDSYQIDQTEDTIYGAAYIEDRIEIGRWVSLIPGVRLNYLQYNEETTFDPRFMMRVYPTEKLTLKTGFGLYHQFPYFDELIEDYGNPELDSEVAYNTFFGAEYDFGHGYSVDLQGYYKLLDNLVASTEVGSDEPYENSGEGYVYGAELLARKRLTDRLFGWVSYTYSKSERLDHPDDDWRLFDWDQTHNFIILASYFLGESRTWRVGARWQYTTGQPYTEIEGAIYSADTDSYIPLYSADINEERLPDFHQLDLRVDKFWYFNRWILSAYIDAQNVYWHEYPFGYRYNHDYTEREAVTYPTFFPSIGLQARF